jgi:predicted nucleic acid-binding protein
MVVITNNSPIRYLVLLDCIHLLPALFSRVTIPAEVQAELQRPRTPAVVRAWIASPPAWVDIRQASGTPEADLLPLDDGEQEAILLAQELHADLVLLDDREARKAAIRRALRVMGTVGVLEQAAIHELIDLPEVCTRLLTTNFRIKDYIIHSVLARDAARKAAAHTQPPEPQEM